MLGQELRDWVLRGGERFMPVPDQVLDTYWRAQRGLPGFYHPLLAGSDGAKYLGVGSIGDIGEGVALSVIESAGLAGLDQIAVCRPIGDAPDFIFQDRHDSVCRGIAEVKASEKADPAPGLVDGVITLLDVFRGWQRHRPLNQSPGLALAVHVNDGGFAVSVIRMRFTGTELTRLKDNDFFDRHAIATIRKALWAGVTEQALRAMGLILSSADKDTADTELASVRKIRTLATASLGASRRHGRRRRDGREGNTKDWAREELGDFAADVSPAEWGDIEKQAGKLLARADEEDRPPSDQVMWTNDGTVGPWWYAARSKADGVELRAFLPNDVSFDNGVLDQALRAGERRYLRTQRGAQAVSCWADGVEWTAFGDGRLLGWIPEVGDALDLREALVAQARQVLQAWPR